MEKITFYVIAEANNVNTSVSVSKAFRKEDNAERHMKRCFKKALAACEDQVKESECTATGYCITTFGDDMYYGELRKIEARI